MSSQLTTPALFTTSELKFSDPFSGSVLNTKSWNTYMTSNSTQGGAWDASGSGGSGLGGDLDADYDEPYEVSVNNGLTLNAVRQSVLGANYINGAVTPQVFPVTAGVADTYGKMEFDGGYLQISMKEPSGDGAWPSLWLLPGAGAGKVGNNFEIDIQEGGYDDGTANPNDVLAYHLHTPNGVFGGLINTGIDLTASFNTFAINWIPGKSITWYLNGKAVAEITSAQATIPNDPMELIMSNQVATSAASSWRTSLDSSTPGSMPMQIAGVQIYQAPGNGESIVGGNVPSVTSTKVSISNNGSGETYSLDDKNYKISLGGYSNSVTAGNGNDNVAPGQGSDTVHLGNGADTITLGGYGNLVTAGSGSDHVTGGLGNDVVTLGNGADTVSLGGYYNTVTVGSGADIISAGSGNDTVTAGSGADTVTLSGFYNTVNLGAGHDVVNGGLGNDNMILVGGSATFNLSGTNETVTLENGASANIVASGSGLRLDLESSTGVETISGFGNDSSAVIALLNGVGGYTSTAQILSAFHSDAHGGSLLSLGASGSLDLVGVAPSSLNASNFAL